jgi:hypothetical protein
MNVRIALSYSAPIFMLLSGCGPAEAPYTDNSQDPLAYARDIKAQVQSAVRQAKSASEPLDYLDPLLTELKQTDRPLGDSRAIYDDLRNHLEQLVADCKKSGRATPNLATRLDELLKLAQSLPSGSPPAKPG